MKTLTRNKWAVLIDYVGFGIGLTFAHTGTVLPAFAATLTDSKALIGLASTVWLGAWLLPQLFAANYLTSKPNKYRYMIIISAIGRPVFWLFALVLALGLFANQPTVLLIIFLLGLAWFAGTDAVVAIAWFDIFGKAMGPQDRGRLMGIGQVIDGILAIGAGLLVGYLLSENGLAYPYNYAAIFALAGTSFFFSWIGSVMMVEMPEAVLAAPPVTSIRDYLPKFLEVWRSDPTFARAVTVRLLTSISEMAAPFYIIHAVQVTKVGDGIVGSLAAVGSIGAALAGLLLGRVAARQGSHKVIQITSWLSIVPPILGLLVALLPTSPIFVIFYIACYLIIGMVNGSSMMGYFNYILDLAPPGYRPIYMGLANTLGGILVFAPVIGGWILDYSTSYSLLFILTMVGITVSAIMSLQLPPAPNRHADPVEEAAIAA
jgi:MFS family permease